MSKVFTGFTDEVCRFVKHATPKEQEEISTELRAHLEDHAEDLAAHGYSREEAEQVAVETMGSVKEIGTALNRQYPFVWLFLSRASVVIALVLAVLIVLPAASRIACIADSLRARIDPLSSFSVFDGYELQNEIDIRREGSAGDIFYFYAADVVEGSAYIAVAVYDENPLKGVSNSVELLTFTDADGAIILMDGATGSGNYSTYYSIYKVPVDDGDDCVTASYDLYGTSFRVEIPLNREAAA